MLYFGRDGEYPCRLSGFRLEKYRDSKQYDIVTSMPLCYGMCDYMSPLIYALTNQKPLDGAYFATDDRNTFVSLVPRSVQVGVKASEALSLTVAFVGSHQKVESGGFKHYGNALRPERILTWADASCEVRCGGQPVIKSEMVREAWINKTATGTCASVTLLGVDPGVLDQENKYNVALGFSLQTEHLGRSWEIRGTDVEVSQVGVREDSGGLMVTHYTLITCADLCRETFTVVDGN
jgi:hypothetical protein